MLSVEVLEEQRSKMKNTKDIYLAGQVLLRICGCRLKTSVFRRVLKSGKEESQDG